MLQTINLLVDQTETDMGCIGSEEIYESINFKFSIIRLFPSICTSLQEKSRNKRKRREEGRAKVSERERERGVKVKGND